MNTYAHKHAILLKTAHFANWKYVIHFYISKTLVIKGTYSYVMTFHLARNLTPTISKIIGRKYISVFIMPLFCY